jgi:serine/threonine protein kinase
LAKRGHNRLVDVYNLGTLAFELMTGWTPFYCEDKNRLKKNVLEAELVCPKSFSKPAAQFVEATMAKDPSTRIGADRTEELKDHAWFQELNFEELFEHKVEPPELPALRRSGVNKRSRAATAPVGRSPFAGDVREDLSEQHIEDWDVTGESFQPLLRRAGSDSRTSSRASCLFMPFLCALRSERRA